MEFFAIVQIQEEFFHLSDNNSPRISALSENLGRLINEAAPVIVLVDPADAVAFEIALIVSDVLDGQLEEEDIWSLTGRDKDFEAALERIRRIERRSCAGVIVLATQDACARDFLEYFGKQKLKVELPVGEEIEGMAVVDCFEKRLIAA